MRLADLGLVRPLADDADLTRTATTVGTPGYMSPEQVRGEELTPASDLYSLGVTLYQLLTGKAPFTGRSAFEVADRHLRAAPPSPRKLRPDCPPWLDRFVVRLLQKRPADRFRDAAAAREALLRRRLLVSPRFRRRVVAAALAVAAVAAGTIAVMRVQRREPASVTIVGSDAVVSDARGREVWRQPVAAGSRTPAVVADLVGDARPEVVLGLNSRDAAGIAQARIAVFDDAGKELASLAPMAETLPSSFPDFSLSADVPMLAAPDLDGDGHPELVWTAIHGIWYPGEVGAWSPRGRKGPNVLLANSGHVGQCVAADLDGDGRQELVVLVLNNPMGFQDVLVTLQAGPMTIGEAFATGFSPDQVHLEAGTRRDLGLAVRSYTPLGDYLGSYRIVEAGRAGITLSRTGASLRLDSSGNPQGSPLVGLGAGPRKEFWRQLADACLLLESSAAGVDSTWAALLTQHGGVLAEPPARLAAELLVARSLARGGRHADAATFLRAARRRDPRAGDLMLRSGEQLFLAGQRRAGLAELEAASRPRGSGRTYHDAWVALSLGSVLAGDEAQITRLGGVASTVEGRTAPGFELTELQAFRAFALARWEDPSLLATEVHVLQAIRVVRLWASLERGADPVAVAAEVGRFASNPEIAPQAALLQAHLFLRRGEAVRARGLAEGALATLERRGRVSLEAFAWVPLGHRVLADTLTALGERDAAADHMHRAAELAPTCWFGR